MKKGIVLGGSISLILVVVLSSNASANHYLFSLLTLVAIYAIAALGLELLMGYGGQISLGNGGFIASGAYITAILSNYGLHPVFIFVIALLGTALIAVLVGLPILRLEGYYLAIATLGFALLIQAFAAAMFSITGGSSGMTLPALTIFSNSLGERGFFYLTWVMLLIGFWIAYNLAKTRLGRSLVAIHSNEDAASALGIHTGKVKLQVFVISAVYAAVSGFLLAYYLQFISPGIFNLTLSVDLIVISLLGGHGVIIAPIVGSIIWVTLKETTHMLHDYHILMTGLALILIIMFFPKGLYPILQRAWFKVRSIWKGKGWYRSITKSHLTKKQKANT